MTPAERIRLDNAISMVDFYEQLEAWWFSRVQFSKSCGLPNSVARSRYHVKRCHRLANEWLKKAATLTHDLHEYKREKDLMELQEHETSYRNL